jgi:deoxyribodipyrimidine photo-lyase
MQTTSPCRKTGLLGEQKQVPLVRFELPTATRSSVEACIADQFDGLYSGPVVGSPRFRGGQIAADAALNRFDVTGYRDGRNQVLPIADRRASGLSPYIRHGLLSLPEVWSAVEHGPSDDVRAFRQELLWQEYARHWYARLGSATASPLRHDPQASRPGSGWDRMLPCLDAAVDELETDGWLVNQARMWLASDWGVRNQLDWRTGEDRFFTHLLDGSRAANRLGWQWTVGVGSSRQYGFARDQAQRRAPELCRSCPHAAACPLEDYPDDQPMVPVDWPTEVDQRGPREVVTYQSPEAVWLTAESLGASDPAMVAHPDLPVVFVFDQPLLARLQLSAKRLIFLLETLAEMAEQRHLEVYLGDPVEVLTGRAVAVTHAPVPGFVQRSQGIGPAEIHPWPWLVPDHDGSVRSFSAWSKKLRP